MDMENLKKGIDKLIKIQYIVSVRVKDRFNVDNQARTQELKTGYLH